MAKKTDVSELLDSLRKQGYKVERTPNNHWKVTAPGKRLIVISSTPSDKKRGTLNVISELKRSGYTFTWHGKTYTKDE